MEATIQFNQMDVDKEEARPNPEVPSIPQERHIWRMPELPPIPQGLNHFSSGSNRNISMPIQKLVQSSQRRGVENMPKPLAGGHELLITHQELSVQEKTIELLGGWSPLSCKDKVKRIKNLLKNQSLLSIDQKRELEMTPALETEASVASISSKPAPEMSKDKPKGPQKKQRGPKNHQGKGKGKAIRHRPYPQGDRIPKLEPSSVDSVFNMARTLMEFTAKEQERINRTFPRK
ncbi:hypothetical protein O181_119220 [Austropuccinia psidii MF-1]|uniref:Uncharacterized protein n=1 Tax=Austropuccinia psidii MF-1 TaxID=1389203 RepID=A0A9Q3KHU4_9BASI|nr:hypothetical protein [Austropuccinia psidii MF-1]